MRAFADDAEHRALVCRTLRVSHAEWTEVVRRFCEATGPTDSVEERLRAVTRAFAAVVPPSPVRDRTAACPCCGGKVEACCDDGAVCVGQCSACGHGLLVEGAAPPAVYDARYYEARASNGAGYARYLHERDYRETKGQRIVTRLVQTHGRSPRTLLEVGSGFGFTRAAAERLGLRTTGVDVNPEAARGCQSLYGLATLTGTAADVTGAFDLVLYQFVLEHVADVHVELANAFRLCAPGGLACFIVPSMEAAERHVFHARYRSFRADHLHLFSRRSLRAVLERAGFTDVSLASECNLHLLHGFLERGELEALYSTGLGPDLFVTARRP